MVENIVKVKKGGQEVWIDLTNLPLKNTKHTRYNYSIIENMKDIEVPFSYKGLKDTLYLTLLNRVPEAIYSYKYRDEEGTISINTINRVALEKITYNERKRRGLIKRFNGKRKVDLSNLPALETPYKYNRIYCYTDFKNSVGLTFSYEFNDSKGILKIIDYFTKINDKGTKVEYVKLQDNEGNIFLYNIMNIIIGNLQRVAEGFEYPYNVGDIIGKFIVKSNTTDEKVAKDGKVDTTRITKLQCTECGMIKRVPSHRISHSVTDTCVDCNVMKKSLKELNKYRSKGESIVEQVLIQNNIDYITEKTFEWSDRKRYDFYLPEFNSGTIIEVHGVQHYLEQNKGQRFHLTLEENKKNDKWKKDKVLEHNLNYIEIDVRESDFDYIKDNVIKSNIPTDNVDWSEVIKNMENGFVKTIIEMYNNESTIKDIANKLKVSSSMISSRLKDLSKLGLVDYTPYNYEIKQLETKLNKLKKQKEKYLDEVRHQ